jgi:uncharacterized protein YkwD
MSREPSTAPVAALPARRGSPSAAAHRVRAAALTIVGACAAPAPSAPRQAVEALDLEAARAYVLELVNRIRTEHGLELVVRDETAERAAQAHAEDMGHFGYTAHWGSDGSVPEERYTRAGGVHFVQENAACFFDGEQRALDPAARFSGSVLEQIQAAFVGEQPPHDGHRRNILNAEHTGLGIGLAQPANVALPCLTQEFIDVRGEYAPLPARARIGQVVRIAGELHEAVTFGGVGLSRIEPRRPIDVTRLNDTIGYPIPPPFQTYFPAGYGTTQVVGLEGRRFSIELPLSDHERPGRYGISVWGAYPGRESRLVMVSLRVVEVR